MDEEMRALVCPTAFKGSLGPAAAARAMAMGISRARPGWETSLLPLSDGGPGLLESLREAAGGRAKVLEVSGPLEARVRGRVLWLGDGGGGRGTGNGRAAAIEAADACGLHLLAREERDPLRTHTLGVGELIRGAVERGAEQLWLGLGGSATVDGGTGMARAFGYRFLDASGRPLPRGGGGLAELARIEGGRPPDADVTALADVTTALTGRRGAARVFGPQKGAGPEAVERLAAGLERLAKRMAEDLGRDVAHVPGGGAAGGLGAACVAFLGGDLVEGSGWMLERAGFAERLETADVVVTGEGAFDATSLQGKLPGEVLRRAREAGLPALLLCGRLDVEPPDGVHAADAGGGWLDEEGLAQLAARAVEGLCDG